LVDELHSEHTVDYVVGIASEGGVDEEEALALGIESLVIAVLLLHHLLTVDLVNAVEIVEQNLGGARHIAKELLAIAKMLIAHKSSRSTETLTATSANQNRSQLFYWQNAILSNKSVDKVKPFVNNFVQ